MRDCETNGSYVAWIAEPRTGNVSVNDVLFEAGCVFYARTTQPQAIMHLETSTNIYGTTTNPWNTDLTSGGSSGGESALVACRGSVLGMGGDIGGSVRCPAANCGIYGFKPTPGRMGRMGSHAAVAGQEGIISTEGPLATSRAGLELLMSTYLSYEPWVRETGMVPLPWRPVTLPPKLKIAIMWDDGVVRPHPPITRALTEVKAKLEAAGMEVVDWKPEGHDECWNLTQALYYEDGGKFVKDLIARGGEPLLPLTDWLINNNENVKYRTVEEVWDVSSQSPSFLFTLKTPSPLLRYPSLLFHNNYKERKKDNGLTRIPSAPHPAQSPPQHLPQSLQRPLALNRRHLQLLLQLPSHRRNPQSRRARLRAAPRSRQVLVLHVAVEPARIPGRGLPRDLRGSRPGRRGDELRAAQRARPLQLAAVQPGEVRRRAGQPAACDAEVGGREVLAGLGGSREGDGEGVGSCEMVLSASCSVDWQVPQDNLFSSRAFISSHHTYSTGTHSLNHFQHPPSAQLPPTPETPKRKEKAQPIYNATPHYNLPPPLPKKPEPPYKKRPAAPPSRSATSVREIKSSPLPPQTASANGSPVSHLPTYLQYLPIIYHSYSQQSCP